MRTTALLCVFTILAATAASAAMPPDEMNYQGVLRDAAGDPIDGSFDMVFRFFDAETLGNEILVDRHLAANAQTVQVTGGLFAVGLGSGEVLDGSGAGSYATLADVFANHDAVWLEIEVGAETLSPRLQVRAAAFALNAGQLDGRPASEFLDTSGSEQAKPGKLIIGQTTGTTDPWGLEVYSEWGGYFATPGNTAHAHVGAGNGDWGIVARGDTGGGAFHDLNSSGQAWVANADAGIRAYGSQYGGYFDDLDGSGYAEVASGHYGVRAFGDAAGAYFEDPTDSGRVYLGTGDYGLQAYGDSMAGFFVDEDSSGYAYIAYGDYGVYALGSSHGGYFKDSDGSGYARLGYGDYGLQGFGYTMGGYFDDTNGSAFAYLGFDDTGVSGYGNSYGVLASDTNSGTVGYLATSSSSTQGNGSKNFVQNHPYRDDQVILYAAPEGNEVATYTRGTARLVKGEARVVLDETFAWVTNPDIGLTAHLTPRTAGAVLHTAELSTGELVVRGSPDDAVFDFMVWGLRIGFEEVNVVEAKNGRQALIPSMEEHRASQEKDPALRKHVALERFKAMNVSIGRSADVDLRATTTLRDAIGVFDPAVHRVGPRPEELDPTEDRAASRTEIPERPRPGETEGTEEPHPENLVASGLPGTSTPVVPERRPLAVEVIEGDLIVSDELGDLRPGASEADPGVVGVAAEDSVTIDGTPHAELIAAGIATLKVDADLGSIRRGDLLVSSPTPGHAMRAYASIPGTIVAKALEPLEAGRGTIRVVVMLR